MRGIGVCITTSRGDGRDLIIEDSPYVDRIFRCEPLHLSPGDSLTVSYDLTIYGMTDGVLTSTTKDEWECTIDIKDEQISVVMIRITKIGDQANIRIYDRDELSREGICIDGTYFPADINIPSGFNASKTG